MRRVRFAADRGLRLLVEVPSTAGERMRGLVGRGGLPPGHAMLLDRARSLHTIGMRFAITVVWLDGDLRVVAVRRLRPWRIALPRRRARHILECADGVALRPGDRLRPVERNASAAVRSLLPL